VTATLLCFGCGGGSSSATNSGNSGGSANNSSDAKQTGDLYGTKKPVSATYTYKDWNGDKEPFPMTFEFKEDGSYVATIEWGITEVKYYFTKNGNVIYSESYDSSKQLEERTYFVNGTCSSTATEHGLEMLPYQQGSFAQYLLEFELTQSCPEYDANGKIIGSTHDDVNKYSTNDSKSIIDLEIERDADGRITKTSASSYYTNYLYSDNSVIMLSYRNSGNYCNGMKVTYNAHGAVSEVTKINEDGTNIKTAYTYTYDDYGFLTSIKQGSSTVVTIEYTY
jgi:hypothetical protein